MKKFIQFMTPLLILAVMASCTKEGPEGPMGPQGETGEQGIQGPAGETAEVNCNECHNESEDMMIKSAEWAVSGHVTGGHMEGYYASRDGCADCHSSQGFQHVVATGEWNTPAPEKPLPANCYTCHKIHETHTVADWAFRKDTPVELITNMTSTDQGNSNTCVQCHQSRIHEPALDPSSTETVEITNKRFGPHHGPQGNMIAGAGASGAYELAGSMTYANSMHATTSSCTECHMASGAGSGGNMALGGHSNNVGTGSWDDDSRTINTNGCVECHTSETTNALMTAKVKTSRDANMLLLTSLKDKLVSLGYIGADNYVPVPLTVSNTHAAAIYNYKFLLEDQSTFIHNPKYAKALLQNSLEALN